MDAMLIVGNCKRWAHAKFVALPRDAAEPVVWVDEADRLSTYHPALPHDEEASMVPMSWDQALFVQVSRDLMRQAKPHILKQIRDLGVPDGYFSDYPLIVRKHYNRDPTLFTEPEPSDFSDN